MEEDKSSETEQLEALANELDTLQSAKNEGRGFQHLRYVIDDLRRGNIDMAKADVINQSDKYGSIPDIKQWITNNLYSDSISPWESEEDFEKRINGPKK